MSGTPQKPNNGRKPFKLAIEEFPELFGPEKSASPSPEPTPHAHQQSPAAPGRGVFTATPFPVPGEQVYVPFRTYDHEFCRAQQSTSTHRNPGAFSSLHILSGLPHPQMQSLPLFDTPYDQYTQAMSNMSLSSPMRQSFASPYHAYNNHGPYSTHAQFDINAELAHQLASENDRFPHEFNINGESHEVFHHEGETDPDVGMSGEVEQSSEEASEGQPGKEIEREAEAKIDESQVQAGNDAAEPWKDCRVPLSITSTQQAQTVSDRRINREMADLASQIFTDLPVTEAEKLVYVERVVFCILNLNGIFDSTTTAKSAYFRFKSDLKGKRFYTLEQIQVAGWKIVNEAIDRQKGVRKLHVTLRTVKPVTEFSSFEARMDAICDYLFKWKTACQDLFIHGEVGILRIVDAPIQELDRKGSNLKNNRDKKETIKAGRMAQQNASTQGKTGQSTVTPNTRATPKSNANAQATTAKAAPTVTPSKRSRKSKSSDSNSDNDVSKPSPLKRKQNEASSIGRDIRTSARLSALSKPQQPEAGASDEDADADGETDPDYQ